jgi:hypothetical protein
LDDPANDNDQHLDKASQGCQDRFSAEDELHPGPAQAGIEHVGDEDDPCSHKEVARGHSADLRGLIVGMQAVLSPRPF